MNIGIDIGYTIKGVRREGNSKIVAPNSVDTIKKLVDRGDIVYLISKANSAQKEDCENFLREIDFFNKTGVNPANVYFCYERPHKALFVKALEINIMVDDRSEVMAFLPWQVVKFLLVPEEDEYVKYKHLLKNTQIVNDWFEIERKLL
jgi:hypothetical protein